MANLLPAVLTIDVQYDFFDPNNGIGSIAKATCLPGVRRILDHARSADWPVVHVVTCHADGSSLPALCDRPFCLAGTKGAEQPPGLRHAGDRVCEKQTFNGFVRTTLQSEIESHNPLVICGTSVECCLLTTAFAAAEEFNKGVFVPFDAVSASSTEGYVHGLTMMAKAVARVVSGDAIVSVTAAAWDRHALSAERIRDRAGLWHATQERLASGCTDKDIATLVMNAESVWS